jgi:hypothetical protein
MALLAFSSLDDFIAFTEDNEALVDFSGVTRDQMASLTEIVTEEMKTSSGTRIGLRTKLKLTDKRAALMDLAKLIQMLGPDRVEHSGQVNHLHAHTVLNPRDMNPHQRQLLKQALLAIDNDEKGDEDDAADHHQAG